MKIIGVVEVEIIVDLRCDVCGISTLIEASEYLFGTLQAHWRYGPNTTENNKTSIFLKIAFSKHWRISKGNV